jgi:phage terminase large subunit GpA-like protein
MQIARECHPMAAARIGSELDAAGHLRLAILCSHCGHTKQILVMRDLGATDHALMPDFGSNGCCGHDKSDATHDNRIDEQQLASMH